MEQYTVTGMSCAACSSRVEKAVSAVPGVTSCSVSLLTGSMGVEGTASADAIVAAVRDAGYGAEPKRRGAESLELMVWSFNKSAREFYEKSGMTVRSFVMEKKL